MMARFPTIEEVIYVSRNMRGQSVEDIFNVSELSRDDFAKSIFWAEGFKWVGYANNMPAAIIGASPGHKGVWSLFGFGTDDWKVIWRDVTRVARRDMMRLVKEAGAHRAHCISPSSHTETHAWLRMLGATLETPMPKYGKDGQDYTMFAWLKEAPDVR